MRAFLLRIIQNILCIAVGALITFIELRFFEDIAVPSPFFFVILAMTVPTVFMYARSDNSVVFVFVYTVCLTLALEISGDGADITVLLASIAALVLLYAGMRIRRGAAKTEKPAYFLSYLTVIVCAAVVLFSTLQLYRHVLSPLLTQDTDIAPPVLEVTSESPEPSQEVPPPVQPSWDVQADQNGGADEIAPPREPRAIWPIVLIALAVIVCALIGVTVSRYLKHRRWLKRTLESPPDNQIFELYRYLLRALAVCGYPRRDSDTPLEYLSVAESDGFPLPVSAFGGLTETYITARYGGKAVTESALNNCRELTISLPSIIKANKGKRFYYLRYVPKMTGGRV